MGTIHFKLVDGSVTKASTNYNVQPIINKCNIKCKIKILFVHLHFVACLKNSLFPLFEAEFSTTDRSPQLYTTILNLKYSY